MSEEVQSIREVCQAMYESPMKVVRCTVGVTDVEVGLHQGWALSPFQFAMVMDRLTDEVRQESLWTMMLADDIVICCESREQLEEKPREGEACAGNKWNEGQLQQDPILSWCECRRQTEEQGVEVEKIHEFKYLGSSVQTISECGKKVKK